MYVIYMHIDNEIVNEAFTLPHMLNQYTNIYNKAGRIGIYTREVSI